MIWNRKCSSPGHFEPDADLFLYEWMVEMPVKFSGSYFWRGSHYINAAVVISDRSEPTAERGELGPPPTAHFFILPGIHS